MKRIITLTLALVLCLSVCACANETPSGSLPESSDILSEADTTEEATATETEAQTEFVPTEDNVIWAKYDVPSYAGDGFPTDEIFVRGEAFVYDFVKKKMENSDGKRLAVWYAYDEGGSDSRLEEIPVEGYFKKGERTAFLTAEEIEELVSKMNDILKDNPRAGFTLRSFTKSWYDGFGAKMPQDHLTYIRYTYGKESYEYISSLDRYENFYNIPGGYEHPEEDHED